MSEMSGIGKTVAGFASFLAVVLVVACGDGGGEPAVPAESVVELDFRAFAAEVRADLCEDGRLDSFLVIDVRLPAEFDIRFIPGAISLPFGGSPIDFAGRFFMNPATGKTGIEAFTNPDGSPIPKGRRMVFYSGRSG